MTSDQMLPICQRIISEVLTSATPFKTDSQQSRHLDCRLIFDLCSHPAIVQRIAYIYGTDLLLWRSHFFDKGPGATEVPWHQEHHYWLVEPLITISAWLAVDEATAENACVQIVPGAHKQIIPTSKHHRKCCFDRWPILITCLPCRLSICNSNRVSSFRSMSRHFTAQMPRLQTFVGSVWPPGNSSASQGQPSATV